jgi:transposase InsO family protein
MAVYGVPEEVLTDNGTVFTGRFIKPRPAEVLFERICRENGITQRLTKPRSPTTTGKIERWHKTLRRELLDHVAPFESLAASQEAIDGWVHTYNLPARTSRWAWPLPRACSGRTVLPAAIIRLTGRANPLSRRRSS